MGGRDGRRCDPLRCPVNSRGVVTHLPYWRRWGRGGSRKERRARGRKKEVGRRDERGREGGGRKGEREGEERRRTRGRWRKDTCGKVEERMGLCDAQCEY